MDNLLNKIKEYNTIIIHGHQRPDGDCFGSQYGLKDIINNNFPEKKVYIAGYAPAYVDFIGEADKITDDLYQDALVIVVDTANQERIEDQRYNKGKYLIKIDHHVLVESYGDLEIVVKSPACAEIITDFCLKNNLKISPAGALALYVGIVTDTGRFRYDGVTANTHNAAAFLLANGVSPSYVDSKLSVETLDIVRFRGYVLSNFTVSKNGFAYIMITQELIKKFNLTDEEAASLVTSLGSIDKCYVWALIIEYKTKDIRVRLRSKGPAINEFAGKYHGGGHPKAAGATLESFDKLESFVNDVDDLIKEYKKTLSN